MSKSEESRLFAQDLVDFVTDFPYSNLYNQIPVNTTGMRRLFTAKHKKIIEDFVSCSFWHMRVDYQRILASGGFDDRIYRTYMEEICSQFYLSPYTEEAFIILCTSIAAWALLAKIESRLENAIKEAIDIIYKITESVTKSGSIENSTW